MSESFAELFQKSLQQKKIKPGDIVRGRVLNINDKFVFVDVGLKSEGVIPIEEFKSHGEELTLKAGDEVDVLVEAVADDYGETRLSKEKAKRAETWARLVKANETGELIKGLVQGKVKGGLTVDIEGVKAFLPGSLIDVHVITNPGELENKVLDFKIIKVDHERSNIVVSRRAVIEAQNSVEREKLLEGIEEGQILTGTVKNLTEYGAFVDLGGIDGLLHITDVSWKRIKSPSELLKLGDKVNVVVLKFDREKKRISLGMKQLSTDPWMNIQARYPKNVKFQGKVTNLADYGCFVELEPGIEGLVHTSELDWTNKNIHPSKAVHINDPVEVMILEIDEERRRISLSIKQCKPNPWLTFGETHHEKDVIKGTIKSITDFGLFVGLEGNIDGLVHLSDLSWTEPGEQAIRQYQKGQEVETIILSIDPERERIALGIKQLQNDPFGNYSSQYPKGTIVKGKVIEVEPKQAKLELAPEVNARLKASEFSTERIEDLTQHLKVGDEVEGRIISINYKDRLVSLSVRAKNEAYEPGAKRKKKEGTFEGTITDASVFKTTIGDLLKEQMENQAREESEMEDEVDTESESEVESEPEVESEADEGTQE